MRTKQILEDFTDAQQRTGTQLTWPAGRVTVRQSADHARGAPPLLAAPPLLLRRPCWELGRLGGCSSAAPTDFLFFLETILAPQARKGGDALRGCAQSELPVLWSWPIALAVVEEAAGYAMQAF